MTKFDEFLCLLNSCKNKPQDLFVTLGVTQEEFDDCIMAGIPYRYDDNDTRIIQLFPQNNRQVEYSKYSTTGLGACV